MVPQIALVVAAMLCALTAGFLFAFAVVVLPGFHTLPDRDYLRAFKVVDRVIQDNSPLFMLVWGGSVVALVAATAVSWGTHTGVDRGLLLGALAAYLFCVQLPTVVINIPINNRIQALDVDNAEEASIRDAREEFERRWIPSNTFRTVFACLASLALMVLLAR